MDVDASVATRELNACRAFFSRRDRHTSRRGREMSTPTTRAVMVAVVLEEDDMAAAVLKAAAGEDEVAAAAAAVAAKAEVEKDDDEAAVKVAVTVFAFVSSSITMPLLDRFCLLSAVDVVVVMLVVSWSKMP